MNNKTIILGYIVLIMILFLYLPDNIAVEEYNATHYSKSTLLLSALLKIIVFIKLVLWLIKQYNWCRD